MKNANYALKGQVIDLDNNQGISGLRVEAWDTEPGVRIALGDAITGADGTFEIPFDLEDLRELIANRIPTIYFKIYRGSKLIKNTQKEQVWDSSFIDRTVIITLNMKTTQEESHYGQFTVKGTVKDNNGKPLFKIMVKAFDKDLRTEQALGESLSDTKGEYLIHYSRKQFARDEKDTADLLMRAYAPDGSLVYETPFDEIVFKAPETYVYDISLTAPIGRIVPEFEMIGHTLRPIIGKLDFAALDETDTKRDISFLNRETGISYAYLEYFVLAHRLGKTHKIDPEFFYALFRENTLQGNDMFNPLKLRISVNLQSDPQALWFETVLLPEDKVKTDLQTAVRDNIISAKVGKELKAIFRLLQANQDAANNYFNNDKPQQLVNIFEQTLKSGKQAELLSIIQKNYHGNLSAMVDGIIGLDITNVPTGKPKASAGIKLTGMFGTDKNITSHIEKSQNIKKPADLAKLARLSKNEWKQVLQAIPDEKTRNRIAADTATLDQHATAFMNQSASQFPSAAFIANLQRDPAPLLRNHKEINKVLGTKNTFDLAAAPVDTQLKGAQVSDGTKAELRKIQRLYKITPDYNKAKVLQQDSIQSSMQIVQMGKPQFVEKYTQNGVFTVAEANKAFDKAVSIHTGASMLAAELKDYSTAADVYALGGTALTKKLEAVSKDYPNLKGLFKGIDICECEYCRSVYSPAAYLVDALEFLKHRFLTNGTKAAKDVLFGRRADIGELDLSCENANTPLPYIDLICEVLEEVVNPDQGLALNNTYTVDMVPGLITQHLLDVLVSNGYKFTAKAVMYEKYIDKALKTVYTLRDEHIVCKIVSQPTGWNVYEMHQTHLQADELSAAPEYVNESAYVLLQNQNISFGLPFNKFYYEGRSLIEQYGTTKATLMQVFKNGSAPTADDIATEQLGITGEEFALITNADPNGQATYWNTGILPLIGTLENVDTFLNKSGLSYHELQQLLALDFINPQQKIFIQSLDNTCDAAQKKLANLSKEALDRIHRFIRLWRKTGWDPTLLNRAIMYTKLGNTSLDHNVIVAIANINQLALALSIDTGQAISFYGQIPDDGTPSLYTKVYQNRTATNPPDEGLALDAVIANENKIPLSQDTLIAHLANIALSLGIKPTDAQLLIAMLKTSPLDIPKLTRDNLAAIYATSLLCRKIRASISDYLSFKTDFAGTNTFAAPATTLVFLDRYATFKSSGFSMAELQWYFQHGGPLATLAIKDSMVTSYLQGLQSTMQQVYTSTLPVFDATAPSDENKNGLKNQLSLLPGLSSADVDKFMSIISGQWNDPGQTPAAFTDAKLGVLFDDTDIKAKITALQAAIGTKETEKNQLIQSTGLAIAQYLFIAGKNAAVIALLQDKFGLSDVIAGIVAQNVHLKLPTPLGNKTTMAILTDDVLIDKVHPVPVLPAITPGNPVFDLQYRIIRLLQKTLAFLAKYSLSATETQWYLVNNTTMGWLEADKLPYQTDTLSSPSTVLSNYQLFEKLNAAISLEKTLGTIPNPADATQTISLLDIWSQLLGGALKTNYLTALAGFTGWDMTALTDLDAYFAFSYPAAYKDPSTHTALQNATDALHRIDLPLVDALKFIKPAFDVTDVNLIRQTLRSKYDDTQWPSVVKPIQDVLRPMKRDALVAYLLAINPGLKDVNDLYDYFLIDVEMGACQLTSRIVLAHGSIQLFVTRCKMGLEPDAVADMTKDSGWSQWDWMKNYRVWEANRKVFLYPENWIQPELRAEKSYFFGDLQTDLQQNEITDRNVEDAAIRYLEKLDDVSLLDVRACYYDVNTYTMHVFGRVRGGSTYYYRKLIKERKWTAWEKIEVDIAGDHLLAYVRNSRLYICWPLMTEEVDPNEKQTIPSSINNVAPHQPKKRYNVQLAVSEYVNNKWQPKRTSQNGLYTDFFDQASLPALKDTFQMTALELYGNFNILCTVDNGGSTLGLFNLTGCKGYPEGIPGNVGFNSFQFVPSFYDTQFLQMQYREQHPQGGKFKAKTIFDPYNYDTILGNTPSTFRITYPHETSLIDWIYMLLSMLSHYKKGNQDRRFIFPMGSFMPFFYQDDDREYCVIPGFFEKDGQNKRTFSDIYQFLLDVIALITKYYNEHKNDSPIDFNKIKLEYDNDPEAKRLKGEWGAYQKSQPMFLFRNFYHPLVCFIKSEVYKNGLKGIMNYTTQSKVTQFNFDATYVPNPLEVKKPYPIEDIDFDAEGSYSLYNWELFFHMPLFVATQLSANQRFEEAMHWFHYIFDPLGAPGGSDPQKYWVTKPFHNFFDYQNERIDIILNNIAQDAAIADPSLKPYKNLEEAVDNWRTTPFDPHEIARTRPLAYQKATLMKYMDNLIAWGDYLFRQDTMEELVQATQLYILVARLLGPQPRVIPPVVKVPYENYNQLEMKVDSFGNALLDMETLVPDLNLLPHHGAELPQPITTLSSLYFCIPQNDQLLTYWDTIADRLFKLRNCQNIDGVERMLSLFAPPIDPGMLVRAVANGMDISSALSDMNAALPLYRFEVMSQKATEMASFLQSIGNEMLSALEKKDAESLALLRSRYEIDMLTNVLEVKNKQIDEMSESVVALQRSKDITAKRKQFYNEREFMNGWEKAQAVLSGVGIISEIVSTVLDATSGGTHLIPFITGGAAGFGGSPVITVTFGGGNVGSSAAQFAAMFRGIAGILHSSANLIGNIGAYRRRMDDWEFQGELADLELIQIDKQIDVANIRVAIAQKEYKNQQKLIENAGKVDDFMRNKFTNEDLYTWMIGQLSTTFFQAYQLTYDLAKKAEQCYRYELATDSNFIKFGYWDTMKKGLLSGEKVLLDIKKMEASYLDKHRREYEITKHVSVAMLAPEALMQLRNTGKCDVTIPEILFDMDYPGQYRRRIKSVALTIPCIAGPLTSVCCTLSLVSNKYRKNTLLKTGSPNDKYVEVLGNDDRFNYNLGSIQSIATSSGQNDSGLFELNFKDERYLPFEGMGAISTWHIEMNDPAVIQQLDYQSISDVIIHLNYTALDGGSKFKKDTNAYMVDHLKTIAENTPAEGLYRVFDLKHDFSNEWYKFLSDGSHQLKLSFSKANLPFFTKSVKAEVDFKQANLYILLNDNTIIDVKLNGAAATTFTKNAAQYGNNMNLALLPLTDTLTSMADTLALTLEPVQYASFINKVENIWVILNYEVKITI